MEHLEYLPIHIEGKNILINGGTTGIGKSTAALLASMGARVMIFGKNRKELDAALQELRETGNTYCKGIVADPSEIKDLETVFKRFDEEFGQMDVLINNAGFSYGSLIKDSRYNWYDVLSTSVDAYLMCAYEASARMKTRRHGHIINIGSMSTEIIESRCPIYVATKTAIRSFSTVLRKDLNNYGIKVTFIEPATSTTGIQEEIPESCEVAETILFCLTRPDRCNIATMIVRPLLQRA